MLDVNTVSRRPTHFLRAVELIKEAREEFNVPSENWPHPTEYCFGIPNDYYYAEVWTDGMDWQPSYWVIEEANLETPKIQPLIIFEHHQQRDSFEDVYFSEFIHGMLYYRRDSKWIHHNDIGYFSDATWPFLTFYKDELKFKKMKLYAFKHASQPRVVFWLNESFIPEVYRGRKEKENRGSGNSNPNTLQHLKRK